MSNAEMSEKNRNEWQKNIKIEEVSAKLRGTFAEHSPLDYTVPFPQKKKLFMGFLLIL